MSDLELWGLIGQIGLVLLVLGFLGWLCRRRPYRDGRRAEFLRDTHTHNYPGFEVISEEDMIRRTLPTETHTEFNGVPCDPGLDYSRLADALNRQDTSVTDHRDQDDDHPGPSWGIIR
jgi:hypothetical protein